MGNRSTLHARALIAVAAVGAVVTAPAIALAAPGPQAAPHTGPLSLPHRTPSVTSVEKQLGHLALQNDQLVEQFNQARVAVDRQVAAVTKARRATQAADSKYTEAHASFVRMVQAQYQGQQSFGAAAALLTSDGGSNYLNRLTTLNALTAQSTGIVTNVMAARSAATRASRKAGAALSAAKHKRDALESKRRATQKQMNKYRDVLSTLSAYQRAAYQSAGRISVNRLSHLKVATSPAARRAVEYALRQVGKPYVFGAAGPRTFDCSGLTLAAWHYATGLNMTHSAYVQYSYGHHVGRNELMPGDLVFFYHPIDHVTIYIGDGLMVSAPTEGEPVEVVPVAQYESDYAGATRLTG